MPARRRALFALCCLTTLAAPLHAQQDSARPELPYRVIRVDTGGVTPIAPTLVLPGRGTGASAIPDASVLAARPRVVLRAEALTLVQEPLFVVDGLVAANGVSYLNPAEIASVEVMRGTAAAALYGARAGAGVIVVTTRRGSSARHWTFGVRTEAATADLERTIRPASQTWLVMNEQGRFCAASPGPGCGTSFEWAPEAARINNNPDTVLTPATFLLNTTNQTAATLANTYQARNWPGPIYNSLERGSQSQLLSLTDLDATGRFGPVGVYSSLSLLSDPSTLRFVGDYRRITGRVSLNASFGRAWSATWNSFFSRVNDDGRAAYLAGTEALLFEPPMADVLARDTLGRLYRRTNLLPNGTFNPNPEAAFKALVDRPSLERLGSVAALKYTPRRWLDLDATVSMDHVSLDRSLQPSPLSLVLQESAGEHALAAAIGATARWAPRRDLSTTTTLRWLYDRDYQDAVQEAPSSSTTTTRLTELKGLLAGTTITFRDRYLLDALVRRDKGLLDSAETFGRLGVSWNASAERWWFAPRTVNRLTVRAARGSSGGVPNIPPLYETGPGFDLTGPSGRITETEVGADLELFRTLGVRLTYATAAADAIMPIPGSAGFGFSFTTQNAGRLDTRTWEMSAEFPVIRRPGVSWSWSMGYDRVRTTFGRLDVPPFVYGPGGLSADFLARQGERYGTMYGRRFITGCGELPVAFQGQCGDGLAFQRNDDGLVVWTGASGANAVTWRDGIARNLWGTQLPSGQAPWGYALSWGAPIVIRDSACVAAPSAACAAMSLPVGNALPDWRFSISTTARWHRFTLFALMDGAMGRDAWNQTRHFQYLNLLSPDADQAGRSVETAKPIGYYGRVGPPEGGGIGGLYDILAPNSWFVESTSYAKLRELSVAFDIGPVAGFGDWTIAFIGRNLFTLSDYRGLDPEVPLSSGPASGGVGLNGTDVSAYPVRRTVGASVGVRF